MLNFIGTIDQFLFERVFENIETHDRYEKVRIFFLKKECACNKKLYICDEIKLFFNLKNKKV